MSELFIFSAIIVISAFISAVSQIILKKAAKKQYPSKIREYLNFPVIFAYVLFFGCSLITMYGLKVVPLSLSPVLESTGFIFVAILSFIFLKEKLTRLQIIGMIFIIGGIIICSI